MNQCLEERMMSWMRANKLKLNRHKREILLEGSNSVWGNDFIRMLVEVALDRERKRGIKHEKQHLKLSKKKS